MSLHAEAVTDALDALIVHSERSYSWLGQLFVLDEDRRDPMEALRDAVEERLYSDFYLAGCVSAPRPAPDPHRGPWPSALVREMAAANAGSGSLQAGWRVTRECDDGSIVVQRDGLTLWADPDDVIGRDATGSDAAQVSVRLPEEVIGRPGGFYAAFGSAGRGPDDDSAPVDRLYWNVAPTHRPALVGAVTRALNRDGLPFRLKVLGDPVAGRCDAGVLYTSSSLRSRVVQALPGILRDVGAHSLRMPVPVFTLPLAPGLGFAEHPPGAESFGSHRCGLLADAAVGAYASGAVALAARLAVAIACLEQAGVDLDHPHRNPGSDARDDPAPIAG